jgi:DNA-binding LacI/PurR family transcriptional regulator
MKIAFFISNYPTSPTSVVYGKAKAAYNLTSHLQKRGHEVHIFTISKDKQDSLLLNDNIIIHCFGSLISYKSENFIIKNFL